MSEQAWVVMDLGCHECGVSTEPVGIFATEDEARAAESARDEETQMWRDGGQTFARTFAMTVPVLGSDVHTEQQP